MISEVDHTSRSHNNNHLKREPCLPNTRMEASPHIGRRLRLPSHNLSRLLQQQKNNFNINCTYSTYRIIHSFLMLQFSHTRL